MSTTSISQVLDDTKTRSAELHKAMTMIADGKNIEGKTLAANTVSTTRHHLKRDQRLVSLIAQLAKALEDSGVDKVPLSEGALQGLNQLCYPDKGGSKVSVKEGDSILALMQEYSETKDLKAKMEKDAEKKGLVLNFKTGKVEKK
jgi:hypothetical protein